MIQCRPARHKHPARQLRDGGVRPHFYLSRAQRALTHSAPHVDGSIPTETAASAPTTLGQKAAFRQGAPRADLEHRVLGSLRARARLGEHLEHLAYIHA
jgi:hypothetical protein